MRRFRLVLWPAGAALGILAQQAYFGWGDARHWIPDLVTGWSLIACGLVGWSRRSESRSGALMAATGFAWFASNFATAGLGSLDWLAAHALYLYRGPRAPGASGCAAGDRLPWSRLGGRCARAPRRFDPGGEGRHALGERSGARGPGGQPPRRSPPLALGAGRGNRLRGRARGGKVGDASRRARPCTRGSDPRARLLASRERRLRRRCRTPTRASRRGLRSSCHEGRA